MRSTIDFRRVAVAVILGSLLLTVAVIARAQSGTSDFATWSTVRQGGKAVTTITPLPGRPGLPVTHVRPDAIGGISRSVASDASYARWSRAIGVPFTSPFTGATQTLGATVARTATKTAVLDAAIAASKVTSPAGWVILGAGVMGAYFGYSPSLERIYTTLVPEQASSGSSAPPGTVYKACYDVTCGEWQSTPSAAASSLYGALGAATSCPANPKFQSVTVLDGGWAPDYKARLTYTFNACGEGTPSTTYTDQWMQRQTGCPAGSTLEGGQCVTPGAEQCPTGYSYTVSFFYGGFECAPNAGTTPVQTVAPDDLLRSALDHQVGTNGGTLEQLLNDLPGGGPGVEAPLDTPAASGPSSLPGTTTTTNLQDGGRIETSAGHPVTYINNTINIGDTITQTTYNNQNQVINQTSSDGATGPAQFPDDYATRDRQCGYPGGPACKIDEEGTPEAGDLTQAEATRDEAFEQLGQLPQEIIDQERDTSWGLSFNPPTSCSNPPAFSLPFAGINLELDMCQWEPQIHAVMSFLWILLTLYSCVSMVREAVV